MVGKTAFARSLLLVLTIVAAISAPCAAGFTIRDLGVISGGSGALAINASGQAAGKADDGGSNVAVRSSASGGFTAITFPPDATSSVATSISASGEVGGYYSDARGIKHGFFASGSSATALDPLTGGSFTQVNGVNSGGQLVGTGNTPGGITRAFIVQGGGSPKLIDALVAGGTNQANGINDGGTVVGTSQTNSGPNHAFLAQSTAAVDLNTRNPFGGFVNNTYGMGISNNGDVVGYGDVGSHEHAFFASRDKGTRLVDIGVLSGSSSFAYAVNDLSHVVGQVTYGSNTPGQANGTAFLWDAAHGIVDLNSLLLPADHATWDLTLAAGINGQDQIAGEGYLNGVMHGFILTPIVGQSIFDPATQGAGSVPAPPALLLTAVGSGLSWVGARIRRGRSSGRAAA